MKEYNDYELDMLTAPEFDSWTSDAFEDALTSALCAGFENKLSSYSKSGNRAVLVNSEKLQELNRFGGYLPHEEVYRLPKDRDFKNFVKYLAEAFPTESGVGFDLSCLPRKACLTMTDATKDLNNDSDKNSFYHNAYASNFFIEKLNNPKYYKIPFNEVAYGVYFLYYKYDGTVDALKHVVSIDKDFRITHVIPTLCLEDPGPEIDTQIINAAYLVLFNWIERKLSPRFYVVAEEEKTKLRFSVLESQAKSLFYSRTLSPTGTGRQKPILHWVQSHKRRLKNGTDIKISEHLRGVTEFEIFGTKMTILCPQKTITIPTQKKTHKGFAVLA